VQTMGPRTSCLEHLRDVAVLVNLMIGRSELVAVRLTASGVSLPQRSHPQLSRRDRVHAAGEPFAGRQAATPRESASPDLPAGRPAAIRVGLRVRGRLKGRDDGCADYATRFDSADILTSH
jgi:hypothetical protein